MSGTLLTLCLPAILLGEARFAEPPRAVADGTGVRITFAVDSPTDVEVAVVAKDGRVVRHLAAGVLGPKAPPPLKAGPLRQEIAWDRTDDDGRAVQGDCTVRVRLGLAGRLERQVGFDPTAFRTIVGLAVNARGELFVLDSEFSYGSCGLRAYSREGEYLRTLIPYSARLPAERVESIGQLSLPDGRRLPIVYNAHGQNLHPYVSGMKPQTMALDPAGRLVLFSAVGSIVEHGPPRHLLRLDSQGGAPAEPGFIGPPIRLAKGFMGGSGEGFARWFDHAAVSPDGQWIYVSGGRFGSAKHMRHAVGRVRPGDAKLPEAWIGRFDQPGHDATHLNDPQGLAVGPAGRLFVADRGNDRIVVHSPDGKRLGEFAVDDPLQVRVHPRTGSIYVTCAAADDNGRVKQFTLRKYSPFDPAAAPPRLVASIDGPGLPVVALDAGADPPRLWLASSEGQRQQIAPVIDRGEKLEKLPDLAKRTGLAQPMFLAADEPRGRLYVTEFRNRQMAFDLKSGTMSSLGKGGEPAVDRDGFVYVIEGYPPRVFLHRLDPEGKPANYPGMDTNKLGPIDTASKGPNVGFRGHTLAANGDIYILQMKFYGHGRVVVYSPAGKLKHEALVGHIPNGSGGLAVGRDGSVYVSGNVKPAERIYPADFADVLPKEAWVWWRRPRPAPWDRPYYNAYLYHWGSVLKFPPAGGSFWPAYKENGQDGRAAMDIPQGAAVYKTGYLNAEVGVTGALWRFHGYGPVPSAALNWGDPSCTCMGPRFALDGFGRLFAPDVFRFAVNVLDAEGNLIARLGRYGNADDGGLSLAWAAYASCSGGKLFLSDMANRRVSVVALTAAGTAEAPVPPGK